MTRKFAFLLFALFPALASCEPTSQMTQADKNPAKMPEVPAGAQTVTLGGGCFWCLDSAYRQLDGVLSVTSGYMGGSVKNPTYEQVCDGTSGHAEVVKLVFDPEKVSFDKILGWFWKMHDPTTLNRQGNDVGPQYRSAIFYTTDEQKTAAQASIKSEQANHKDPIVTEVTKASEFYPAENYHQNYYELNKSKNPYCRIVIEPKLKKLDLKH